MLETNEPQHFEDTLRICGATIAREWNALKDGEFSLQMSSRVAVGPILALKCFAELFG